jgi:hypothetical protein
LPTPAPNPTGPSTPNVSSTGTTLSFHKDANVPPAPIQRTAAQVTQTPPVPSRPAGSYGSDDLQTPIPLGLREGTPNPVVRLESEENFDRRISQKVRQAPHSPTGLPDRALFPEEPVITRDKYVARAFPAASLLVEPNYVCYGRLYFQERNAERYGWDLGMVQPVLSAGVFFFDVATLPYHWGANLCKGPACSAGQCLPGDPVPYMIYPPELSVTGAVCEAAAIGGLLAAFP